MLQDATPIILCDNESLEDWRIMASMVRVPQVDTFTFATLKGLMARSIDAAPQILKHLPLRCSDRDLDAALGQLVDMEPASLVTWVSLMQREADGKYNTAAEQDVAYICAAMNAPAGIVVKVLTMVADALGTTHAMPDEVELVVHAYVRSRAGDAASSSRAGDAANSRAGFRLASLGCDVADRATLVQAMCDDEDALGRDRHGVRVSAMVDAIRREMMAPLQPMGEPMVNALTARMRGLCAKESLAYVTAASEVMPLLVDSGFVPGPRVMQLLMKLMKAGAGGPSWEAVVEFLLKAQAYRAYMAT